MNAKELIGTLSREIRQEGCTDFAIIIGDGRKCYVKGPLRPSVLETALLVMGSQSAELRKAINRARARLYHQLQEKKQKGGEA